jgi:hypothetical protein
MRAVTYGRSICTLLVLVLIAVSWVGGELHRENCQHAGKTACSVLPWVTGKAKTGFDFSTARPYDGIIDKQLGR